VFQEIKKRTGEKKLWLRATGSTLVSQFIDSFVVLFIAFYLSNRMDLSTVIQIGIVNYIFKFIVAIALTPLLYLIHGVIDSYLGDSLASELKNAAKA